MVTDELRLGLEEAKMDQEIVWQYDEFKQIGKDYGSQSEVEVYDSSHATFRDLEAESLRVLDLLELKESDALIEFGSGTGTFALMASQRCRHVHAVDVSLAMLDISREKTSPPFCMSIKKLKLKFL